MRESKVLEQCKAIMEAVVEKGFTKQIQKRELETVIILLRGMDKRTVKNWINTLERLGFIKALNPFLFELRFENCGDLLNKIVEKGQKKLM